MGDGLRRRALHQLASQRADPRFGRAPAVDAGTAVHAVPAALVLSTLAAATVYLASREPRKMRPASGARRRSPSDRPSRSSGHPPGRRRSGRLSGPIRRPVPGTGPRPTGGAARLGVAQRDGSRWGPGGGGKLPDRLARWAGAEGCDEQKRPRRELAVEVPFEWDSRRGFACAAGGGPGVDLLLEAAHASGLGARDRSWLWSPGACSWLSRRSRRCRGFMLDGDAVGATCLAEQDTGCQFPI